VRKVEDIFVHQDWSLRQDAHILYRNNIALEKTEVSSGPVIKSINDLINKAESEIEEVRQNIKMIYSEEQIEDPTHIDLLNREFLITYDKAIKLAEISLNMAAKVKQLKDYIDKK